MDSRSNRLSTEVQEKQQFVRELTALIQNYVRPILFVHSPSQTKEPFVQGGTLTIVDTGKRILGITNQHVVDGFRRLRHKDKKVICQLNEMQIDIESRLIAEDENLDIATLRLTEAEIESVNGTSIGHGCWPVQPPAKDEEVVIVGYPGKWRKQYSWDELEIGHIGFALKVSDVSRSKFVIEIMPKNLVFNKGAYHPNELFDFGGVSGSGTFVIRGLSPEIVGIISRVSPPTGKPNLLVCARTDLIREDGTLPD